MEPGPLRHRVTIEALTGTPNQYGETVDTWAEVATVWASREDLTGRELFQSSQVRAEVTTRFLMRYRDGVTASMRLRSDGVTYNIASVADPDGRKASLVILAAREG